MPLSPDLKIDLQDCLDHPASTYNECLEIITMRLQHHVASQGWVDQTEFRRRVSGRSKDLSRIEEKVDRHGPRDVASFEELDQVVSDIAGTRVILDYPYQVEEMVRWIEKQSEWKIRRIDDSVRPAGYRSVHIDVVCGTTHHECVPCEIQVRTLLEHAWANWSHPFYEQYRSDLDAIPLPVKNLMKELSNMLHACDNMAQELHGRAMQLGGNHDE